MAQGLTLQQLQQMGAKPVPTTGGLTAEQLGLPQNHLNGFQAIDNRDILSKVSDFLTQHNIPGSQLGTAIGNSVGALASAVPLILKGDVNGAKSVLVGAANQNNANIGRVVGDTIRSAALPASLALAAPASVAGAAAQYGALSAAEGVGEALSGGKDLATAAKEGALSGATGAVAGGAFNLLGRGIDYVASKAGPSALSFTSGVPKAAITQAADNPALAKQGLGMSVREVRDQMLGAHQALASDLTGEFQQGLKTLSQEPSAVLPDVATVQSDLLSKAKAIADKFRVQIGAGAKAAFGESAIVKPGEQSAVQETLNTIQNWSDFTPAGMQDLAERVGSLRNFESGAKTQSSAIVGQIYHTIAGDGGLIPTYYPDLAQLRTNFSKNKTVLDEIGNVIGSGAQKPTQIQSAVTRLDNLFKDNRDEYLNAVRQLADRSGTDFLSLLAGGEFQKVLPGFIRGLGGGGAVGVGASFVNPWLWLLAPLFSPRAVGAVVRNAPAAAQTVSQAVRAATAQAIPPLTQGAASQ